MPRGSGSFNIVENSAELLSLYGRKIKMVNETVKIAGGEISEYLFENVAHGVSFPELERRGIPCGRDYFYERYRKFFWLLDKVRE